MLRCNVTHDVTKMIHLNDIKGMFIDTPLSSA